MIYGEQNGSAHGIGVALMKDELKQSMMDEQVAAEAYRRRAANAREYGDMASADLWEHIAGEEDDHYREFEARLNAVAFSQGGY